MKNLHLLLGSEEAGSLVKAAKGNEVRAGHLAEDIAAAFAKLNQFRHQARAAGLTGGAAAAPLFLFHAGILGPDSEKERGGSIRGRGCNP